MLPQAAFKSEMKSISEKGISQSYVDKVKKAWIEKYKVDVKKNEYWISALQDLNRGERTIERILHAEKYYQQLTSANIKEAALIIQKSAGKMIAVQMPQ